MFAYRVTESQDELDDTTPLPELTLYDLLEPPTTSTTSKEQQLSEADNDIAQDDDNVDEDDEDECEEEFLSSSLNESLNTPKIKKPSIVRILENKRITAPAPIGTALKNMLGGPVRIVSTPPTKSSSGTEVKILNKLQQPVKTFANVPVKIGSTTIATPSTGATKNLSGVTMTPIKMADGKVLFLQKSIASPGGAATKLPLSGSSTRLIAQSPAAGGGGTIRQTVLPKGVTITSSGLIKSGSSMAPIAVKGLTTIGTTKPTTLSATTAQSTSGSTATSTTALQMAGKMPIKVVRTADGKLIKLNTGAAPSMLLNAKASAVAVKPAGSTSTATATTTVTASASSSSSSSIKPATTQVIIKGPLKQIAAGTSLRPVINNPASSSSTTGGNNSSSSNTGSSPTAATLSTGKMLVQGLSGKQIVVANKNIIKLSPKPPASGSANASASSSGSPSATTSSTAVTTPSGLHAIQLPGKSGVQYVRVLPNSSSNINKVSTSPQKVPLGRPRSTSGSNAATVAVGSTSKIVMKTMGGSIVPLPSMQTLVPRRTPSTASGAAHGKAPPKAVSNNANLETARKHRLSDLNVQIKHLINDSNDSAGPDAKKARYVISMPQTATSAGSASATTTPATQQQMQKLAATRPTSVQRVTVQGASSSSSAGDTRKVYNLVTKSDANGVKYMICNKGGDGGKPRTVFNTTMRRGYTLADPKLRRPTTLTPQQMRFKQMKLQQQKQVLAQAQAKLRQQQQQKQQQQQQSPQSTKPQLQKQQQQQQQQQKSQSTAAQANKAAVPGKPLFDILKPPPPPTPAPAAPTALDALGGSRRKHCNCSKSQCLKLYCDCFANGEFCQDCTCKDCFNNLDYEVKRERAIRSCLERNPSAFKPKITAPNSGDMRLHNKGCNCKRSGCLKNYCECYEAKIPCSAMCKCVGCRNMEDRPDVDMDSMDSLGDAKVHTNKMKDLNGAYAQDNRSNVYLTDDVIEATIMCMISRIVMHEKQNLPVEDTEREVMEELGESLNQIITFAKDKNDTIQMDEPKTTA